MTFFTPREIVSELDRFIIGQSKAKRAVTIALRNRWRRQQVKVPLRDEILPKNILMIGPTGIGKTEISRRLAKLSKAPFIKVEATKFTEVGYVGRDVEQIIRDLVEVAITQTRLKKRKSVKIKAEILAEESLLNALVGDRSTTETREKFRLMLREKKIEDREIEIELTDNNNGMPTLDIPGIPGAQMGMININEVLGKNFGGRVKPKRLTIKKARIALIKEESDKLIEPETIIKESIQEVEQNGIVFLDEIDKICAHRTNNSGDISREGVQRDLLPLIEGTCVSTKHGILKTDHILFIASGAFHLTKPSDLLPELQGRLPIRVELKALSKNDFIHILTEPESSLIRQYKALMATEGLTLDFTDDAIETIATLAEKVNENVENIGARRLQTVMEKILEEISFSASDRKGEKITIDAKYVNKAIGNLAKSSDLSKFIL